MKKFGLVVAVAALTALVGCQQVTETKTNTVVQMKKVGDSLIGNYKVTYVDPKDTGFIAFRSAKDQNGNGSLAQAGEMVSAQIGGTFTSDLTLNKLAALSYFPATIDADDNDTTAEVAFTPTDAQRKITWVLAAPVFIGQDNANSATLTIEAGTLITATGGAAPGMLVISRGSKINAVGTDLDPIVFTSDRLVGSRAAGDWGGVIINGNAPINDGDDNDTTKAGGSAEGEGNTGKYGGTNAADNSGTMSYVRIEFAGKLFTADNELNGLALQGVGSGTTLSYIQIHQSADDGIEFFGGTVSVDHLVLTGNQDDSLDWTSGWVGKAQYGIVQQYTNSSTDLGIEADNKEGGVDYLPRSTPTIANFTVIGRGAGGKNGALFRRGTAVSMYNSLFTGFAKSLNAYHSSGNGDALTLNGLYLTEAVVTNSLVSPADTPAKVADNTARTNANTLMTNAITAGAQNVTTGTFALSLLPSSLDPATNVVFTDDSSFKASANPAGYTASTLPAGLASGAFLGGIDPAGADWTKAVSDATKTWITNAQN